MKTKRMALLGSSLVGLALCATTAAQAADAEIKVEESTTVETTTPAPEAAVAAPAPEEDKDKPRGFYVGNSVGGSFFQAPSRNSRVFNSDTSDTNNDGRPDAFSVDSIDNENNFMWSIFAGYRLADWLGAEVGWTDIGGFSATDVNDPSNPADPAHNDQIDIDVDGLEVRLRAWIPLGTEWVSGIIGPGMYIYSSHPDKSCAGPNVGACTPGIFSRAPTALDPREDSGQTFTLSAGLQFKVTDWMLVRTEYAHFFSVLDEGVHLVSASVVFGFYDFFGQGKASGGAGDFGGVVVE